MSASRFSLCLAGAVCLVACGASTAADDGPEQASARGANTGVAAAVVGTDLSAGSRSAVTPSAVTPSALDWPTLDSSASTNGWAPQTVVDDRGRTVTVMSTERVIPLDGDIAEIVFALGLGDRVVATDLSATYPPAADALPQIGYQRALDAEPILDFDPTLLIGTDLAGPVETIDALERVGIPVVIAPSEASPVGPAEKIRAVADALGVPEVGEELAADVQREIDAATVDSRAYDDPPRVVALYLRGRDVQLMLGEGSGIDWLIEAAGAIDIADELGVVGNAPISAEALVAAAPDAIIVPATGLESAGGTDGLLSIPGIEATPAGSDRAVLAYDDQLMLGNGPRTGAFLAQLVDDLQRVADSSSSPD